MSSAIVISRGRKGQRKSRKGCGNCKIRKVKCDENKPKCKRCIGYGVFCNYDSKYSDLELSASGAFRVDSLDTTMISVPAPTLRFIATSGLECSSPYQLQGRDFELVQKFQHRTVFTISNPQNIDVYLKELVKIACSYPHLMHAIIIMTLMHDRHLASITTSLSAIESFHWCQALSQFNKKLSGPVQPMERDSLWATAMCLGVISFYYIEAQTPEKAWPLAPASATDLGWLTMTEGKKSVWRATGPPTAQSLFDRSYPDLSAFFPKDDIGLEALPTDLLILCGLNSTSDDTNPYRYVALSLARILHVESMMPIIFSFLSLIGNLEPVFKQLLRSKDPCAMLLLAYFYAKICQYPHWWLARRAYMEGQSICLYLRKYCSQSSDVQSLLEFPTSVFAHVSF